MRILQWSTTIPKSKQEAFLKWFKETAGPLFCSYGAKKHELYKVEDKQVLPKSLPEENRFIEKTYFDDDFEVPKYFEAVKKDEKAWAISRLFESEFGAHDIELRILKQVY